MNAIDAALKFLSRTTKGLKISLTLPTFARRQMSNWTYFKDAEVVGLDTELVAMLDRARHIAEVPFIITSGKRTIEENQAAGGVLDSSHLKGLAVDLRCQDSTRRWAMLDALFKVGFKRLGIYPAHLHVDLDPTKDSQVAWFVPTE